MRPNYILNARPFPRAIVGGRLGVFATANDPAHLFAELNTAFRDFRARSDGRLDNIEASINEKIAALGINGGFESRAAQDPEYTALFASYFRNGNGEDEVRAANAIGDRGKVQAAMSVGTPSEGGYLAPVEWDRRIRQAQVATSAMRRLATIQTTSVGAFSTVWSDNVWGSGWVGETAARPATATPTLSTLAFDSGEIYANATVSQRLLDDAQFDLEKWLADQVDTEFSKQEDIAFLSGNGTNKPRGFLGYVTGGSSAGVHPGGNLTTTTVAGATAITADELVDFSYSLPAPYRANASWLMNSLTGAKLAKLKNSDGDYIWREGLVAGQPATLLGRPVEFDENMPASTAGLLPIAFGDFRAGYLINDRLGTRILRDPYTNKPFVQFYVTRRVGGGVQDPNAIRLIKMAAS